MPETKIQGRSLTALRIANSAVRNARLKRAKNMTLDEIAYNLAKVLMVTPPRSDHGLLLMRALSPAIRDNARSAEELAARWLLAHGQTPTESAIATRLEMLRISEASRVRKKAKATRIAERDGLRAAAAIESRIAQAGESFTWIELARSLDWPLDKITLEMIMHQLERSEWIVTGTKSRTLRPGSRYLVPPSPDSASHVPGKVTG
jgi:hypothetical protein